MKKSEIKHKLSEMTKTARQWQKECNSVHIERDEIKKRLSTELERARHRDSEIRRLAKKADNLEVSLVGSRENVKNLKKFSDRMEAENSKMGITVARQSQRIKELDSALIKYKAESRKRDQTLRGLQEAFNREVGKEVGKFEERNKKLNERIDRLVRYCDKNDDVIASLRAESELHRKEVLRLEKELRQTRGLDFTTHIIEKPGDQVAINFEFVDSDTDQGIEVIELFDWPRESVRGAKFAEIRFCPPKLGEYTGGAEANVVPVAEGESHDATRVMTPAGLAREFNKANPHK